MSLKLFNALTAVVFVAAVVWAEGGLAGVLAEPAVAAFLVLCLALFVAANFTDGNLSSGVREDRGNRWVFVAFAVFGLGSLAVSLAFDRADILTLDGQTVRWIGVALAAVGGVLRLAPVFILGHRFSGLVAIQPGHRLVTGGLYARIRNPSYLGLMINAVGSALVFRSAPGVVLALMLLWPLHARMVSEERLLDETFGDEYRAYRARTARLIPGLY